MAMAKQLAVQVHNPGGALRVVSTKPMPGMQWIKALTNVGCRVEVLTLLFISTQFISNLGWFCCRSLWGGDSFRGFFVETSCSLGSGHFVGEIEAGDDVKVCIMELGTSKQGGYNMLPSWLSFRVGVKNDWESVSIHFLAYSFNALQFAKKQASRKG